MIYVLAVEHLHRLPYELADAPPHQITRALAHLSLRVDERLERAAAPAEPPHRIKTIAGVARFEARRAAAMAKGLGSRLRHR